MNVYLILLTKHRSIEYTRTIQLSCLHRSVLFDYNRSIVYSRSTKPIRAEFSNFYHLVSYALPPYFLSFVCFLFRIRFKKNFSKQTHWHSKYANFFFFSIYLFRLVPACWGFLLLVLFLCLLFLSLSLCVTFFLVLSIFQLNSQCDARR